MSQRRDDTFIVAGENAFPALPRWLKERGINTYSLNFKRSAKGSETINVGYDSKPDKSWSKYEWRGRVVVLDAETHIEKVIDIIDDYLSDYFDAEDARRAKRRSEQ